MQSASVRTVERGRTGSEISWLELVFDGDRQKVAPSTLVKVLKLKAGDKQDYLCCEYMCASEA